MTILGERSKDIKKLQINQMRDTVCYAPVQALGHTWQADMRSQDLLNKAISLASLGLPLPTVWRDADNVGMPITSIADLLAIAGAIALQTQAAYELSWSLKAQVDAATNLEEVEMVQWPALEDEEPIF